MNGSAAIIGAMALVGCGGRIQPGADAATAPPTGEGGAPGGGQPGGQAGADAGSLRDRGAGDATLGGFDAGLTSVGGTITFQMIGAAGSYFSRRDPASGPCDAYRNGTCCMTNHAIAGTALTPWDEELGVTFRGPMVVKEIVVYQPDAADAAQTGQWQLVSAWDERSPNDNRGIAFSGAAVAGVAGVSGFAGVVGNKCLIDVSTSREFPCGPGSVPYCPTVASGQHKYYGWAGSKLIVVLASMPHHGSGVIANAQNCSNDVADNWYDAPWIGVSHGELLRQGLYNTCQCYSNPASPFAGNGCGQINAFEVVNDNNSFKNLDVFSTNFFGYGGYVGEGPCGGRCDVAALGPEVDLVDKATDTASLAGAVSTPTRGPGAALRRPAAGYRYFIILLDVPSRTVQLGLVHPSDIPALVAGLLPNLPPVLEQTTIDNLLALRLPR